MQAFQVVIFELVNIEEIVFSILLISQFDTQLSLRHQQARAPASARMGCGLSQERLCTEPYSNCKATLIG